MRAVILILLFLAPAVFINGDPAQPRNSKPRLVLVLSIDQMRFDYLTRFEPLYEGGFRWLIKNGAIFTNARYRHANTETGPGHSVILTGRHASHSGIVANGWYDSFQKKYINVVEDPVHKALGSNGRGATPANLIGFTVGDMLKNESSTSRVVSISLKDRSAVLMGGHRADAAYWYDGENGSFVSSTFYMDRLPSWLEKINAQRIPNQYAGKKWERLKPDESLYVQYAGPDAVEGEWDRVQTTFPHEISSSDAKEFYYEFRRTPFADEYTLKVALEAMKAHDLGTDDATDIFAIGFSASDVIGHTYGCDSQEILDHLLRLDLYLQTLFRAIDERVGLSKTIVVLSADHGAMPLVEVLQSQGIPARRVSPAAFHEAVVASLTKQFPNPAELIEFDPPHFRLKGEEIAKRGLKRTEVEAAVMKAVQESELVAAAYTHSDILGVPPADDPFFTLVCNSFFQPRSPDIIVVLKEYIYMDDYVGGTGHGTPHDYDRHVPVIFAGPGIRTGKYDQPSGPEDIAPTLGALLKLTIPKEDDARVLSESIQTDTQ